MQGYSRTSSLTKGPGTKSACHGRKMVRLRRTLLKSASNCLNFSGCSGLQFHSAWVMAPSAPRRRANNGSYRPFSNRDLPPSNPKKIQRCFSNVCFIYFFTRCECCTEDEGGTQCSCPAIIDEAVLANNGFLPGGLFPRLIGKLVSPQHVHTVSEFDAEFCIGSGRDFAIEQVPTLNVIKLSIVPENPLGICRDVLSAISKSIEMIGDGLSDRLHHQLLFRCPHQYGNGFVRKTCLDVDLLGGSHAGGFVQLGSTVMSVTQLHREKPFDAWYEEPRDHPPQRYDIFLSYKHVGDSELVENVHDCLRRVAVGSSGRRPVVFVDKSETRKGTQLITELLDALRQSELVVPIVSDASLSSMDSLNGGCDWLLLECWAMVVFFDLQQNEPSSTNVLRVCPMIVRAKGTSAWVGSIFDDAQQRQRIASMPDTVHEPTRSALAAYLKDAGLPMPELPKTTRDIMARLLGFIGVDGASEHSSTTSAPTTTEVERFSDEIRKICDDLDVARRLNSARDPLQVSTLVILPPPPAATGAEAAQVDPALTSNTRAMTTTCGKIAKKKAKLARLRAARATPSASALASSSPATHYASAAVVGEPMRDSAAPPLPSSLVSPARQSFQHMPSDSSELPTHAAAPSDSNPQVFISHTQRCGQATTLAVEMYTALESAGFAVWLDVKMLDKSTAAMKRGVLESKCVIAVITGPCENPVLPNDSRESNAYFKREYCVSELRWAREAGIPIQPVIQASDKSNIGSLLQLAPADLSNLGETEFITLDRSDRELLEVGTRKVIRAVNNAKPTQSVCDAAIERTIEIKEQRWGTQQHPRQDCGQPIPVDELATVGDAASAIEGAPVLICTPASPSTAQAGPLHSPQHVLSGAPEHSGHGRVLRITSTSPFGMGRGKDSIDESARREEKIIEDLNMADTWEVDQRSAHSRKDVQNALCGAGKSGTDLPLIVHLIGHGEQRGLKFADRTGAAISPNKALFAEWVRQSGACCVILNACHGLELACEIKHACGDATAVMCWKGRVASECCVVLTMALYEILTDKLEKGATITAALLEDEVFGLVRDDLTAENWLGDAFFTREDDSWKVEWHDNPDRSYRQDDDNILHLVAANDLWPLGPEVDCSLFLEADGRLVASPEFGRFLSAPTSQIDAGSQTVFRGKNKLFGVEKTLYPRKQNPPYPPAFTAADWNQFADHITNKHAKLVFSRYFHFEVPSRELWYEIDHTGKFIRHRKGNKDKFLILHVHFVAANPVDQHGNFGAVTGVNARWSAERPLLPPKLDPAAAAALSPAQKQLRDDAFALIGNDNPIIGRTNQLSSESHSLTGNLTDVAKGHMAIGQNWKRYTRVRFLAMHYDCTWQGDIEVGKELGPNWIDPRLGRSDADLRCLTRGSASASLRTDSGSWKETPA